MLGEEELKDAALLVFANKQDQPGARGAGDISEALRLGELRDRNWSIIACSAIDGKGINEGMDWLVVNFSANFSRATQTLTLDSHSKQYHLMHSVDDMYESTGPLLYIQDHISTGSRRIFER